MVGWSVMNRPGGQLRRVGRRRRAVVRAVTVLVAISALAGCSGVPSSSTPQVVRSLQVNSGPVSIPPPSPGTDQHNIVLGFLSANASGDSTHAAALQYLTPQAAAAWKPTTAVIFDARPPSVVSSTGAVTVTGTEVGALSAGGTFTLPSGTTPVTQVFKFQRTVAGYRITNPPVTLLLRDVDFRAAYHLEPLYFLNTAQTTLIPDLRYSSAANQSLADWLLAQLQDGPQSGVLANLPDQFPSQIVPSTTKVTVGSAIVVQLPGFKGLGPPTQMRIAAELAYTYHTSFGDKPIEVQDGSVTVPVAGQLTFDQSSFPSFDPAAATPGRSLYYVNDGSIYDSARHAIVTQVGATSVAVSGASTGASLPMIAAVAGNGRSLLVGNANGLSPVKLGGVATSRPDWSRDGTDEAWLGVGRNLKRVSVSGVVQTVPILTPQGSSPLTPTAITSVRFSPDGARVALVLVDAGTGSGTTSSAWVGNVVRTGNVVQVQGLHQFTPKGWYVKDLSWIDPFSLFVVDNEPPRFQFHIYTVRVDGSFPEAIGSANSDVPLPPVYITATDSSDAWVSIGTGSDASLWRQAGSGWQQAFSSFTSPGSAPAYSN